MKRLLRWLAVGIATVLFLALAGAVTIYVLARRALHHRFPVPHQTITLPTDSIAIAEGGRLARIRGCLGCHGDRGQGEVFFDEPGVALLVAPNLTRALTTYDNSQIEGIVRHGVRPTGRGVLAMPATAFRRMSDTDFGEDAGLPPNPATPGRAGAEVDRSAPGLPRTGDREIPYPGGHHWRLAGWRAGATGGGFGGIR